MAKSTPPTTPAPGAPPQLTPVPMEIAIAAHPERQLSAPIKPLAERTAPQYDSRIRLAGASAREQLTQQRAAQHPSRVPDFLTGPSPHENAMRNRIRQLSTLLSTGIARLDQELALARELLRELKTLEGGESAAEREGFPLEQASQLVEELDAVVDKFSPAKPHA